MSERNSAVTPRFKIRLPGDDAVVLTAADFVLRTGSLDYARTDRCSCTAGLSPEPPSEQADRGSPLLAGIFHRRHPTSTGVRVSRLSNIPSRGCQIGGLFRELDDDVTPALIAPTEDVIARMVTGNACFFRYWLNR